MFIAMNQFRVSEGRDEEFIRGWQDRDTYLDDVEGFIAFHLLRGDEPGDYISHTTWESREAFLAWAQSESFRRAHAGGMPEGIIEGHPRARFYDAVLSETPARGDTDAGS